MLSCSPAARAPGQDKPYASLQAIAFGDAISALRAPSQISKQTSCNHA